MQLQVNTVYLLLGGNKGDVKSHFIRACELMEQRIGRIFSMSPLYASEAWGFSSDSLFLNQVIALQTQQMEDEVLEGVLRIEEDLGRVREFGTQGYQNRSLDIDILFFNQLICEKSSLIIPHPRLHLRKFTLCPLNDIAPALVHPVFQKTIEELLAICPDNSEVSITE